MPPPKPKRSRRSRLTITGGLFAYDPKHANPAHPLAHLTREERWDALHLALGDLILATIEHDRRAARGAAADETKSKRPMGCFLRGGETATRR